ncbi:MAG: M48 family metalloprotease, partial [Alphaproteobacteria bacterium]|nr:M48 family metalloprotease [Alphaproteobacteria bacterium]
PAKGVVSALGLQLVMQIVFGSGDSARAAGLMHELLQQRYARDLETEADAVAAETLHAAHIDHRGIIAFFERMRKKEGKIGDNRLFSYFSSHPATKDRITALEAKPRTATKPPLLTAKEWQELRGICGKTEKRSF